MKPLLLLLCLFLVLPPTFGQNPDFIAVRKKNGRTIKNFFAGSDILLQTTDGRYFQGPIKTIRNDSVFILLYDIRSYPTNFGTMIKDTITVQTIGLHHQDIKRIHISKRRSFLQRTAGPLLMLGGAGYFAINVLNGALFDLPITDKKNLRTLGIAGGSFGVGYFLSKLFSTDGFSKSKHRIVYVDIQS